MEKNNMHRKTGNQMRRQPLILPGAATHDEEKLRKDFLTIFTARSCLRPGRKHCRDVLVSRLGRFAHRQPTHPPARKVADRTRAMPFFIVNEKEVSTWPVTLRSLPPSLQISSACVAHLKHIVRVTTRHAYTSRGIVASLGAECLLLLINFKNVDVVEESLLAAAPEKNDCRPPCCRQARGRMTIPLTGRLATHGEASHREVVHVNYKQVPETDGSLCVAASKEHCRITESDEGVPEHRHGSQRSAHGKPLDSIKYCTEKQIAEQVSPAVHRRPLDPRASGQGHNLHNVPACHADLEIFESARMQRSPELLQQVKARPPISFSRCPRLHFCLGAFCARTSGLGRYKRHSCVSRHRTQGTRAERHCMPTGHAPRISREPAKSVRSGRHRHTRGPQYARTQLSYHQGANGPFEQVEPDKEERKHWRALSQLVWEKVADPRVHKVSDEGGQPRPAYEENTRQHWVVTLQSPATEEEKD